MFLPVDMSYIKKIERKDILYVSNTNVFFFTKSDKEKCIKINIFTKRTNSNIY